MGVTSGRPMDLSANLWELVGLGSPVGVADANRAKGSEYWQLDATGGGVRWYKVGPLATDWNEGAVPTASDVLMADMYGPPPDMGGPVMVPDVSAQVVLLSQLMAPPDQVGATNPVTIPPANDADRALAAALFEPPPVDASGFLPRAGGVVFGPLLLTGTLALGGIAYPAALGASQNNYSTAGLNALYFTASANINITGFADGSLGRVLLVTNYSAFTITLTEQDAASIAANRFSTGQAGGVVIAPNYSYMVVYDAAAARWRPLGYHT